MGHGRFLPAACAVVLLAVGCSSYYERPSYAGSSFQAMVGRETVAHVGGRGGPTDEVAVRNEIERLLSLEPPEGGPSRVVLHEVPGTASRIDSPLKRLQLREETSAEMKSVLEQAGAFDGVEFLPELLLPAPGVADLGTIRLAAARAQADTVLLYSTEVGYEYEPNAWAIFYPTIVGTFLAPGSRAASMAVSKAALVDVRTGYIYDITEVYARKERRAPCAFIDPAQLEYDARLDAVTQLARAAAEKAEKLAEEP